MMNLERAVEILNAHNHAGHGHWEIKEISGGKKVVLLDGMIGERWLTQFEAIAVAEKYFYQRT